jgi:hypothetical protein
VKCSNDGLLLPKEETVVQGMIDRLIEIREDTMEWKRMWKKTKVMRISKLPSPVQIMIGQKQLENVKYLEYLGSTIINDARCTCEIKSRIAMAVAAFNKKKLFASKFDSNLKKKHQSAAFGAQLGMVLKLGHFRK